ncbi:MAG: hypothetical protein AAB691_01250 [Patescibacteria group bacterium]
MTMHSMATPQLIEIAVTPKGDAPEEFRKHWIGTRHIGLFMPAGLTAEYGFESVEVRSPHDVFIVSSTAAFIVLEKRCPEGAAWFRSRSFTPAISFGANEVRVIKELPEIASTMEEIAERLSLDNDGLTAAVESALRNTASGDILEAIESLHSTVRS